MRPLTRARHSFVETVARHAPSTSRLPSGAMKENVTLGVQNFATLPTCLSALDPQGHTGLDVGSRDSALVLGMLLPNCPSASLQLLFTNQSFDNFQDCLYTGSAIQDRSPSLHTVTLLGGVVIDAVLIVIYRTIITIVSVNAVFMGSHRTIIDAILVCGCSSCCVCPWMLMIHSITIS